MRKYFIASFILVPILLFGIYWMYGPPRLVPDHLCEYVSQTLHLECVDVLQATEAMHPGAVTTYRPKSDEQPFGRAEIPHLDLLRESCRVPGTAPDALTTGISQKDAIALPTFSYDLTRALREGVEIPLPKLEGAKIIAGPTLSHAASLRISNKSAWMERWDEGAARQAFASCNIKQECIDLIKSAHYKVVSATAVADGLSYEFKDSSDNELALSAGGAADIDIRNGGHVKLASNATASLVATSAYVIGVRFFPDQMFANQPTCAEPIRFSADGLATVTVNGGGGSGNIGGPFSETKPLGKEASIAKNGTEKSECDAALDLTVSEARVVAQVDSPGPGRLQFSYSYSLSGGHYDTVAACPLGKWVGKTGHDNTTNVSAELVGRIRIVIRTNEAPRIKVLYPGLTNGVLQVLDPMGKPVLEIKQPPKGTSEGPPQDNIASSSFYSLEGPGSYMVEYNARLNVAQGGAGRDAKSEKGILEVTLE